MSPHHLPARRITATLLVAFALFASSCAADLNLSATTETATEAEGQPNPPPSSSPAPAPTSPAPAPTSPPAPDPAPSPDPAPDSEPPPPPPPAPAPAPLAVEGTPAQHASITEISCPFEGTYNPAPQCYQLGVPEDWDNPESDARVLLTVARFPGRNATPETSPMIYLEGGPGGNTLEPLDLAFPQLVEPFLSDRDVIVFDQRGAGLSEPELECPELDAADRLNRSRAADAEVEEAEYSDATAACAARLASNGIDLTEYHSVNSANDLEAMRILLGIEQWNVLGISYGTRLAQTLIRLYPDGVRSVVLDGIVPNDLDLDLNIAVNAQRSFKVFFDACIADAACNAAYPDLEARFFALVEELDRNPVIVNTLGLLGAEAERQEFTGQDLLGMGFQMLYSEFVFEGFPELIAAIERGDLGDLEFTQTLLRVNDQFFSVGMYLSVECHEERPFVSGTKNPPSDPRYEPFETFNDSPVFCEGWEAGAANPVENEPVNSDIPALLFGGQYDPITPPSNNDLVAPGFPNNFNYTLPHLGHGVSPSSCGAEITNQFFEDPFNEPDSSCIAEIPAPRFVPN